MTTYRSVNEALPVLAHLLLTEGADVPSRVGATKELTFQHFTILDPLQREIVVPGRKANVAAQIAETMWVLSGRNDVAWLEAYLPRAADFSDDGKTWRAGYGPRLRNWGPDGDDQLKEVILLLRQDPTTRRAVMSIWDPRHDMADSKDIPCNNWLHFLARDGVLNLHVAIRSNDLVWGWSGINQFEWSVLLEIVAYYTGLQVGRIHYAVSSLHMYDRHWDKAPTWKPRTVHTTRDRRYEPGDLTWDELCAGWFEMERKIRVHADERIGWDGMARRIADFPEPMLRSWLWVLAWWWSGDEQYLTYVQDSRLWHAVKVGTGPRKVPVVAVVAAQDPQAVAEEVARRLPERGLLVPPGQPAQRWPGPLVVTREEIGLPTRPRAQRAHPTVAGTFVAEVTRLHTEKDASYGTSWKKRGELFSILPNIARKADRLGAGDTTDENQTDTAVDLMVYLAKYRTFLWDERTGGGPGFSDTPHRANGLIRTTVDTVVLMEQPWTTSELEDELKLGVEEMCASAEAKDPDRFSLVDHLLIRAAVLAMRRWRETPALFARPVGEDDDYRGADRD